MFFLILPEMWTGKEKLVSALLLTVATSSFNQRREMCLVKERWTCRPEWMAKWYQLTWRESEESTWASHCKVASKRSWILSTIDAFSGISKSMVCAMFSSFSKKLFCSHLWSCGEKKALMILQLGCGTHNATDLSDLWGSNQPTSTEACNDTDRFIIPNRPIYFLKPTDLLE